MQNVSEFSKKSQVYNYINTQMDNNGKHILFIGVHIMVKTKR